MTSRLHSLFVLRHWQSLCVACVFIGLTGSASADDAAVLNAADVEFFEQRIRPVLIEHCYECHAADSKILRGGLQVDSRDALRKGGDSGPAVVPGKPTESLLIAALRHESFEMPPEKKLPDSVIADFVTWIEKGAVDPRTEQRQGKLKPVDWDAAAQHWAFQPIPDTNPPDCSALDGHRWIRNPVDQFIFHRLKTNGLQPAPETDKRTLIRRATFDLIGLPPTVSEVHDFLADESEDAFARVVDRLLSSPQYGERWGRHWLDLVRYADTNGADENHQMPNAWRYRDWVIQQINRDLPFDQFIRQQLAGDLLPVPADEREAGDLLTATGMLVIGPKMLAEQDKDKMVIDIVDEQLDTVSRTMLGLTVGCARCHDHKFDPISTRDYYALAGIFYSTRSMADRAFVSRWMERPRPSKEIEQKRTELQPKLDEAKNELERLQKARKETPDTVSEEAVKKQQALVEALEKEIPAFEMVMSVEDDKPVDLPVHIRGNHLTLGPDKVTRTMPTILSRIHAARDIAEGRSGRLELADWLVSPSHPLTSRVMVNRIWMWHFGKALMRSPSNFGLQAEAPTHPELLNWLSTEFIRRKWSLKDMHRLIMLSSTYRMSSQGVAADEERDPENRLWRRQNRKRLEAEPIRDAVLFSGGLLDLQMGNIAADTNAKRRAVYLPINRSAFYEMFSTFDYVETANHIEQRPTTTVPQQALFVMNSSLVNESANALATDLLKQASGDPQQDYSPLIAVTFERLFARLPTESERQRALAFLNEAESLTAESEDSSSRRQKAWAALCRALIASNEFVYVD
jgi:hypothetical protein